MPEADYGCNHALGLQGVHALRDEPANAFAVPKLSSRCVAPCEELARCGHGAADEFVS